MNQSRRNFVFGDATRFELAAWTTDTGELKRMLGSMPKADRFGDIFVRRPESANVRSA